MRRVLFPILGLGELAASGLLVVLGLALPGREDLRRSFAAAVRVTAAGGSQVRAIRDQVDDLRRSGLGPSADRLAGATRSATGVLRMRRVDFEEVEALRDATDRAAEGLDALAGSLDPEALATLGVGLESAADVLDRAILPASADAARELEATSGRLGRGARQLADLIAESPSDLAPLRDVGEGLARFDQGFAAMDGMLDPRRLVPLRRATDGAEGVVREASRLASRAAGYSYPVIAFNGLRPKVQSRPFWPAGAKVGADMREVAAGVTALGGELDTLAVELPKVQEAVRESRRTIASTRQALESALERRAEAEELLKELPEQAARLAEALPDLAADLARGLREVGRLRDLVDALRRIRIAVESARSEGPRARAALGGTAAILRSARDQLDLALEHRDDYAAALDQVGALSDDLAARAPEFADRVEAVLGEEDRTLDELTRGLEGVEQALPAYEATLIRCLGLGRSLAWLVAGIAGLHGLALIAGGLRSDQPSASSSSASSASTSSSSGWTSQPIAAAAASTSRVAGPGSGSDSSKFTAATDPPSSTA